MDETHIQRLKLCFQMDLFVWWKSPDGFKQLKSIDKSEINNEWKSWLAEERGYIDLYAIDTKHIMVTPTQINWWQG